MIAAPAPTLSIDVGENYGMDVTMVCLLGGMRQTIERNLHVAKQPRIIHSAPSRFWVPDHASSQRRLCKFEIPDQDIEVNVKHLPLPAALYISVM